MTVTVTHPLPLLQPVLSTMSEIGMPLLVHGEVAAPEVDNFDRERVFIQDVLSPLRLLHPTLKVKRHWWRVARESRDTVCDQSVLASDFLLLLRASPHLNCLLFSALLQIVLEHITTEEAVAFVLAQPLSPQNNPLTAATITPQHLMYNRSRLFLGGRLHPHLFCLPVLKVNVSIYVT